MHLDCINQLKKLEKTTLADISSLFRQDHTLSAYVVVQFYPWFKFSFLLFQTRYHVIIIHCHTQKQKERKCEPRIKLNHNKYNHVTPLLHQLSWLLVVQLLFLRDSVIPYKCVNNLTSTYLCGKCLKRSTIHSLVTRRRDSLEILPGA